MRQVSLLSVPALLRKQTPPPKSIWQQLRELLAEWRLRRALKKAGR